MTTPVPAMLGARLRTDHPRAPRISNTAIATSRPDTTAVHLPPTVSIAISTRPPSPLPSRDGQLPAPGPPCPLCCPTAGWRARAAEVAAGRARWPHSPALPAEGHRATEGQGAACPNGRRHKGCSAWAPVAAAGVEGNPPKGHGGAGGSIGRPEGKRHQG